MPVRDILKMGDPRLLRQAEPVTAFDTPELHALIADMFDTMHAANGAGLAAPQIGVNLQVVIFGFKENSRYAPQVPETVLLNPVLEPLSDVMEEGWEGCLSVPGLRGVVSRYQSAQSGATLQGCLSVPGLRGGVAIPTWIPMERLSCERWKIFMRGWCSTNATI
jgi:peptide deformylase